MDENDNSISLGAFFKSRGAGLRDFYHDDVIPKFVRHKYDIGEDESEFVVFIDKNDIACAVSEQGRDALSEKFVSACLYGDVFEYFVGDYDYFGGGGKSYVVGEMTPEEMDKIQRIYIADNGTDDEDEYAEMNEAQRTKYFIENDSDIYDAVSAAYNEANEVGAANVAEEDVIKGI